MGHPNSSVHRGLIKPIKVHRSVPVLRAIDKIRVARGISLEELSLLSGYHKQQISAWLSGKVAAPIRGISDVAEALNLEITVRPKNEKQ